MRHDQHGFMLLVPVVILLIMVTGSAALIVESTSLQTRLSRQLRELEQQQVELDNALNRAILLTEHIDPEAAITEYQITGGTVRLVEQVITRDARLLHYALAANSSLPANLAARLSVVRYSLLTSVPAAALMLNSSWPATAHLHLQYTRADATPLASVWSSSDFELPAIGTICQTASVAATSCDSIPSSHVGEVTSDIEDSGIYANATDYPKAVLAALFYPAMSGLTQLQQASTLHRNCHGLNAHSAGIYYIQGDCTLRAGQVVGTVEAPIVLLVAGETLVLEENSLINGLVIGVHAEAERALTITSASTAWLDGALVLTRPLAPTSSVRLRYHPAMLLSLQRSQSMQRSQPVAGSWRDFE
ncbi:hypothetical protein [Salinimonas sediminis]|uniref:Type 4 fimbrial biogenesis protein PilX N-terminal domain-containing protein n=1 Tax=Salinimonas sediminis TaxID=2303538 RepID=A0A346NNW2_9ALTE|nr:hypothetical protein [Salinimonas sediminis]AXR07219.1 hypothetical protein D0Y50_13185 [Salinimonas sediminis]